MKVLQTPTFARQIKKINKNQKADLDIAVKKIVKDPSVGVFKKSDLRGIQVYKFRMVNQLTLLAYEFYEEEVLLILISVGPHENFYRELKK
jgi:mRNA-degrading endonuclease RelE of RelBE toxin-antitoxin system